MSSLRMLLKLTGAEIRSLFIQRTKKSICSLKKQMPVYEFQIRAALFKCLFNSLFEGLKLFLRNRFGIFRTS